MTRRANQRFREGIQRGGSGLHVVGWNSPDTHHGLGVVGLNDNDSDDESGGFPDVKNGVSERSDGDPGPASTSVGGLWLNRPPDLLEADP